ncbi:MAG: hypothetical protein LBU73_07980 [Helicobacteraceae bacterium]|jgi:hypothetical protein|nr:hypothetical protein [Helicobacteraceae bacterium]
MKEREPKSAWEIERDKRRKQEKRAIAIFRLVRELEAAGWEYAPHYLRDVAINIFLGEDPCASWKTEEVARQSR